jgi:hypothetical protein
MSKREACCLLFCVRLGVAVSASLLADALLTAHGATGGGA